ncbi:RNA polymerase sigma-70 factor [Dinghuibacter silviterrae]|uniref:RNA polymerase sigma-70 factor (ECF subfamily) n=1 Tax=Dinghuibacter silviterrae TaxID=1539049 RepID=A0A4R8DSN5_9BACT|nr:RNA polymerase sigma-70 factor [Dinghuibacter silviterrae]TDX00878.1 RNA polymerase sigma-70 factor (ECF subfamily) [Dinghuibacter silviterrae]
MTGLPDIQRLTERITYEHSEQAYKQLFLLFYKDLYRFAYSMLKAHEASEEVVSDVMMRLWIQRERLPEIRSLRVYLFTAIRNAALNYLEQHHRYTSWDLDNVEVGHDLDLYNPEEILLKEEWRRQIETMIRSLPPQCQMAYKLVREEGLTYKEVASIMGIAENTVDRHLNIAFRKLTALARKYQH